MACESCGHKFLHPFPTSDELDRFYSADYQPYHLVSPVTARARLRMYLLRQAYGRPGILSWLFGWVRLLLPNYPRHVPDGRVLDVGCGAGTILLELRVLGWQCEGIDMAAAVAERLGTKGIKVHVGDALAVLRQLPADSYDAVLGCHSFEHVADPLAVMKEVVRILKPGGQVVVTVPNIEGVIPRHDPTRWASPDCPGHLGYFTPSSLRWLAQTAGLGCTYIVYVEVESSWLAAQGSGVSGTPPSLFTRLKAFAVTRYHALTRVADTIVLHAYKQQDRQ